jgi:hypothetical protein
MRRPCHDCVLVSVALALMLAVPVGAAFAQDLNKLAATFNERFPADEISTPPPPDAPEVKKEHSVTTTIRAVRVKRPRSRVVVVPRSFLNAGTNVLPGERKFLDYAFPPTHAALDVVSNTGGRVGWHHSPLPGPFFPQ